MPHRQTHEAPLTPIRAHDPHDWAATLSLIREAFAYMETRIDPPSSIQRTTVEDLRRMATEGELWVIHDPDTARPIACMALQPLPDRLYIGKVAVASPWRGKGLSRRLMDAADTRALALGLPVLELQVRVELIENHAIYARMGFVEHARTAHPGYDRPTSI